MKKTERKKIEKTTSKEKRGARIRIQNVLRKRLVLRVLVCTVVSQLQLPCTSMHCHIPKYMYCHNNIYTPKEPRIHEFMYWHALDCISLYRDVLPYVVMYYDVLEYMYCHTQCPLVVTICSCSCFRPNHHLT